MLFSILLNSIRYKIQFKTKSNLLSFLPFLLTQLIKLRVFTIIKDLLNGEDFYQKTICSINFQLLNKRLYDLRLKTGCECNILIN